MTKTTVVAMHDRKEDYISIKQFKDMSHEDYLKDIIKGFGMELESRYSDDVKGMTRYLSDYLRLTIKIEDIK